MSINNEVYEEWGENRNDIIYLQYWIGNEEDEAQAYTDTYGVEMPTVTWDMGGTGNNLTLGAAMVKATTGIWKGGTYYIITPDHEFMNIGEGNFREFLEDSLKIGKGDEVPVLSQRIDNLFSVSILNSNKLQFSVSESGKYGYSLLNLKGQTLRSSNDLTLQKGELVSIEYEGLAKQVAILQITSPIGVICETVFLR